MVFSLEELQDKRFEAIKKGLKIVFLTARFAQGVSTGLFSFLVPLIIREITPVEISSKLGTMHQLFV
jgi:hypothetical protein